MKTGTIEKLLEILIIVIFAVFPLFITFRIEHIFIYHGKGLTD